MAVTAALINQQAITRDLKLTPIIDKFMGAMPPLFKSKMVAGFDFDERALKITCPVTKKVLREKGDSSKCVSFQESPAWLAEWDEVDLDCTTMCNTALESAWGRFLTNTPHYDDYEDMISKFIIVNYEMFAGRKLILVCSDSEGACGGCNSYDSYSLLDASPRGVFPIGSDFDPAADLTRATCAFQRHLRHFDSSGEVLEQPHKDQLKLQKSEIDRFIRRINAKTK